ncbi:helix-turn-helix domain-containing protein [Clostridium pasteurianum]|uniref:helix-turn-helix domain-containing protein n=1 Tax=Clostridium pasteurianum TaxID=1501 RepID=UPI0009B79315|nr:helix-turn-helix transcriptional regulator [Clostridium pasteurianum]
MLQEKIIKLLGVSRQAVLKLRNGRIELGTNNLIKLAEILDVSLEELTEFVSAYQPSKY